MNAVEFGRYLKSLRQENRLTASKLARAAQISQSYISQIEVGVRGVPSKEILIRISNALGIDHKEFLNTVLGREIDSEVSAALNSYVIGTRSVYVMQDIRTELRSMLKKIDSMKFSIESLLEESGDASGPL